MLEVRHLAKTYGAGATATHAIADVSFTVDPGEFACVVGPSGCGKTTLLKCIAGLLRPSRGEVVLRGKRVTAPPEEMAFVFQDYSRSLFPWMTVEKNVSFPLSHKGVGKKEARAATEEALDAVGLGGRGKQYPWQMSGGMQQRVAIARALAYRPKILLMDEPFASVDAQTRAELEDLLLSIWQRYETTVLFVTHDIDEAVYLADRVLVLRAPAHVGLTVEVDLPRPRDQLATKAHPDFAKLRSELFAALQGREIEAA